MSDAEIRDDLWSWVDQDVADGRPAPSGDPVLAILVSRDGAAWLPQALTGLAQQTRRPDRLIAIDNGSADDTGAVLAAARDAGHLDAVYAGQAGWGFGEAVASARAQDEAATGGRARWLWLLHDDAVAEPDCLAELLVHVAADDKVKVTGPKLLMPSRRFAGRQISELGASITPSGSRELALSPGEIDQGQHEATATLGVSTCGMLVAADVFDALGGFDRAVPLFRDGVEFGWRANLAEHRVATSPRAVMTHRQVGRAGARAGVAHPTATDRAYGMLTVTAHRRGLAGPATAVGLMAVQLLRALFFLLGKAPGRAADELRALRLFVGSTSRAHALRRRIAAMRPTAEGRARAKRLRPSRLAGLRSAWGSLVAWVGDLWSDTFGAAGGGTSLDELTGDDFAGTTQRSRRRPWVVWTVVTLVTVALLSLVAGRQLLRAGHLAAPQLLPAQDTWVALLRDYTAPIAGAPGEIAPPWLGLVTLFSLLTFGQPELLVSILVMGAVPLAALAGHFFLRRLTRDRRTRLVGAVGYGVIPALLGATNRGDLGLVVAAVVLPLVGLAVLAWRRRGTFGFESWRGPFAVAMGLTVLAAFSPLTWLIALVAGLVAAVVTRGRHLTRVAVALVVPLALLSPWMPTLAKHPGRLLTGFEPILRGSDPVDTLGLLVARTPTGGLPPLWVSLVFFGTLWVLGLIGLALRPKAARGWALLSLAGLATAVTVTRFIVIAPMADEPARPQAGMWLLIAFAALIALIAQGWDHIQAQLSTRGFGLLHGVSLGALVTSTLATVVGIGWWVAAGETGPIHRTAFGSLPAVARQTQLSGAGLRTLLVDTSGPEPTWALLEGDGARLGDTERGVANGGSRAVVQRVRTVVADLVSGRVDEGVTEELVRLGVGHLVVSQASPDLISTVGSLPGLAQVTADERGRVWRVTELRSRAMLVTGSDVVAVPENGSTVGPGASGRRLVLAEPADPRWRLTVGGEEVAGSTVEDDPRQWFAIGARAGEVRWELRGNPFWAWLQLAGFLAVAVLAAPSLRRTDQTDPELFARRAARLDESEVSA